MHMPTYTVQALEIAAAAIMGVPREFAARYIATEPHAQDIAEAVVARYYSRQNLQLRELARGALAADLRRELDAGVRQGDHHRIPQTGDADLDALLDQYMTFLNEHARTYSPTATRRQASAVLRTAATFGLTHLDVHAAIQRVHEMKIAYRESVVRQRCA